MHEGFAILYRFKPSGSWKFAREIYGTRKAAKEVAAGPSFDPNTVEIKVIDLGIPEDWL